MHIHKLVAESSDYFNDTKDNIFGLYAFYKHTNQTFKGHQQKIFKKKYNYLYILDYFQ